MFDLYIYHLDIVKLTCEYPLCPIEIVHSILNQVISCYISINYVVQKIK